MKCPKCDGTGGFQMEELLEMSRRPTDSTAPDGWLSAEVALKAIDLRASRALATIRGGAKPAETTKEAPDV